MASAFRDGFGFNRKMGGRKCTRIWELAWLAGRRPDRSGWPREAGL